MIFGGHASSSWTATVLALFFKKPWSVTLTKMNFWAIERAHPVKSSHSNWMATFSMVVSVDHVMQLILILIKSLLFWHAKTLHTQLVFVFFVQVD